MEKAKAAELPAEVASDFYICTLSSRTIVYKVREEEGEREGGREEGDVGATAYEGT